MAFSRRPRRCSIKTCRKQFMPLNMNHRLCGDPDCAVSYAEAEREKRQKKEARLAARLSAEDRKQTKAKLAALRPLKWYEAKVKTAMHAYVRFRDLGKQCISCDKVLLKLGRLGGDYDAGHLRSVGSARHLRYDERNVHGQCKDCNHWGTGMYMQYRAKLVLRIGLDTVEALESDQEDRRYRKDDLIALEAHYKAKLKELKAKDIQEAA